MPGLLLKWSTVFALCYCLADVATGLSLQHGGAGHHPHNHHHHHHNHHLGHGGGVSNERVQQQAGSRRGGRFSKLDQILVRLDEDSDRYAANGNGVDEDVADKVGRPANESFTTERWLPPVSHTSERPYHVSRNPNHFADDNANNNNNGDDEDDDDDDDDEDEDDVDDDDVEDDDNNGQDMKPEDGDPLETQADSETGRRSHATEMKWRTMGSRKDVDMLFNSYRNGVHFNHAIDNKSSDEKEALLHSMKMSRETACKVPKAKIIKVADLHPSTSKYYLPACTILHQCAEDSGCCSGAQKCGAKTTKRVILYFNTVTHVYLGSSRRLINSVEKLTFYNHTDCECHDSRDEEMPRDASLHRVIDTRLKLPETNCRCPSEYTVRHLANGSCSCDCFDKQRDCIKYKKGNEYFNHRDRLCIEMESCLQPSCDFGVYMRRSGRCPRKHEKFRPWSRFT